MIRRCFLAISIPETIRSELKKLQIQWKNIAPRVGWVKPESLHITLKFLGSVEESVRIPLQEALLPIAAQFRPFPLAVSRIGAFPSFRRPRVYWVGIQDGEGKPLASLAEQIESVCLRHGFSPEERGFHAHLTMGRVKGNESPAPLIAEMNRAADEFYAGSFTADHMTLFQSILQPSGAVYQTLALFPFQK